MPKDRDPWIVGERVVNGRPIIIRMREMPPRGVSMVEYPYLISILWSYERTGSGLPPEQLHEQMGSMEERLDVLESTGTAYMMVTVTGHDEKEWFWYTCDVDAFSAHLNEALSTMPPLPLAIEGSEDPEWEAFAGFAAQRHQSDMNSPSV